MEEYIRQAQKDLEDAIKDIVYDVQGSIESIYNYGENDWYRTAYGEKDDNKQIKRLCNKFVSINCNNPFKDNRLYELKDEMFFAEGHMPLEKHLDAISDYIEYYYPLKEQMLTLDKLLDIRTMLGKAITLMENK